MLPSFSAATVETCNFESTSDPWCSYTQDKTDAFDWKRISGSTSSVNTGPFNDHTYGSRAGHYVYMESSAPQRRNDTTRIISKVVLQLNARQCQHSKGTSSENASQALSLGMEWKIVWQQFTVILWFGLLNTDIWKPQTHSYKILWDQTEFVNDVLPEHGMYVYI